MTTACLLASEDYSANGNAETPVQAAAEPRVVLDDLVAQCKSFRSFVFVLLSKHITDLFRIIDEVAFQRCSWIAQAHGHVDILNQSQMRQLAEHET